MISILSRFLLIPAFYFTAKYGDQGWMILLVSFLGITNGHLTVCVMTVAPKGYKVSSVICNFHRSSLQLTLSSLLKIFGNLLLYFVGTGAKCFGQSASGVFARGHIFWGCPGLAVAHRKKECLLKIKVLVVDYESICKNSFGYLWFCFLLATGNA